MTLRAVQKQIAANWQVLYKRIFGVAPVGEESVDPAAQVTSETPVETGQARSTRAPPVPRSAFRPGRLRRRRNQAGDRLVLSPEESVAVTIASPLSVIFQSMTPVPGLYVRRRARCLHELDAAGLGNGPATKLLAESATVIFGFGSTASVLVSR